MLDIAMICGFVSALSYGVADYVSQRAGRTVGVWRTSFYYYVLGVGVLSAWLLLDPAASAPVPWHTRSGWLAAIASGFALLAAVLLFTKGLVAGNIAVVVPITATYGAVTTLLSVAMGERFSRLSVFGVGLIIGGACLVAMHSPVQRLSWRTSGVHWALAASLAYGIGFWLQGAYAVPALGAVLPVWVVYVVGAVAMLTLQLFGRVHLSVPARVSFMLPTLMAGTLSIVGFVALTEGLRTKHLALVVALSSLTSAVTVLLARAFNSLRLGWHQWFAMGLICAGLVLVRV